TGADDDDLLAHDIEGQGRVDGFTERIEDRGDLLVDAGPVVPDVGHGQGHVFGESPVAIHAEPEGVGEEVTLAGHAVTAAAAGDVPLATHEVTRMEVGHVAADLD